MNDFKTKVQAFYNSIFYPVLTVLFVYAGHVSEQDVPFIALILLSLIPGLLVCSSIRFAAMPVLSLLFTVAIKDYTPGANGYAERFLNPPVLIVGGSVVLALVASLVFFLIRNRKICNRLSKNGIWTGAVVFCAVMLFNGAFSANYTLQNVLYVLLFSAAFLAIYFLFALYMPFDSKAIDYLMYCFLLAGLVICAELITAYFTTVVISNGAIDKGSVVLGWGIWTAIGGMLAFLMPACFYFAASHKHGWIAFGLGLFEYLCAFLSQSRGAFLFGTLSLVLCLIYLFFKGKNRKINRVFILALLALGALVGVLFFDKVRAMLGNVTNLALFDNGRFEKWEIGINNFLTYPVFGSGFYDSFVDPAFEHGFDPYLYHNTFVQMLGACGALGLLAYLYHRIQTLRLLLKKINPCKVFIGIAFLAFFGFNLLDVLFFKFYPTFFYALMLLCAEHSEKNLSE